MSTANRPDTASMILDAIRAKRERQPGTRDVAEIEAALLADIEAFDLDAAERRARGEQLSDSGGLAEPALPFPRIDPDGAVPHQRACTPAGSQRPSPGAAAQSSLLDRLRQQAARCRNEQDRELAEQTQTGELIDRKLKQLFFFLHDFVEQLNVVRPPVPRRYPLTDDEGLDGLVWQEGFADYRTLAQSAGALVELVSFTYRLTTPQRVFVERQGAAVDRFRNQLFDFGLKFSCEEIRNRLQHVEQASFDITGDIAVSARWRADFAQGLVVLETRNLERLGPARLTLQVDAVDQALLDEFGSLVLGQPNRFRELAARR